MNDNLSELALTELVAEQREKFLEKEPGVEREVDTEKMLRQRRITAICGIRRCGKSTLLRQIANRLEGRFHYMNFDDERLIGFKVEDFAMLMRVFEKRADERVLLFDEIQNIEGWERFVRRIHDEEYKVIVTGSNAKLLSSELGTHLTGRYNRIELFPFSFSEALAFRGENPSRNRMSNRARLLACFDDYIAHGGFPEYLRERDTELLQRVYEDILFRDIIARYNVRDTKTFQSLSHYLFTNYTSLFSYHGIKNMLSIKSATSVRDYIGYMEQSYLLFEVMKYDYSLKKQHVSHKKIYAVDNGLRHAVSFQFSEDKGKALENMVCLELRRRGYDVFFFKNRGECDFIALRNNKIEMLTQVCTDLNMANRPREMNGLFEAMHTLDIPRGTVLTYNQDGEEKTDDGRNIRIMPVWRWMLEQ